MNVLPSICEGSIDRQEISQTVYSSTTVTEPYSEILFQYKDKKACTVVSDTNNSIVHNENINDLVVLSDVVNSNDYVLEPDPNPCSVSRYGVVHTVASEDMASNHLPYLKKILLYFMAKT